MLESKNRGLLAMITDDHARAEHMALIFVHDPFVAEDIARTVSETDSAMQIRTAHDNDSALSSIQHPAHVTLAILQLGPEEILSGDLGQALQRAGTRIVLMGDEAEEHGLTAGYDVLHRPFRTVDLLRVLRQNTG